LRFPVVVVVGKGNGVKNRWKKRKRRKGKREKTEREKKKLSLTSPTQSPRLLRSTLTALPPRDSITSSVPDFTM
jgi:hypothetical protein